MSQKQKETKYGQSAAGSQGGKNYKNLNVNQLLEDSDEEDDDEDDPMFLELYSKAATSKKPTGAVTPAPILPTTQAAQITPVASAAGGVLSSKQLSSANEKPHVQPTQGQGRNMQSASQQKTARQAELDALLSLNYDDEEDEKPKALQNHQKQAVQTQQPAIPSTSDKTVKKEKQSKQYTMKDLDEADEDEDDDEDINDFINKVTGKRPPQVTTPILKVPQKAPQPNPPRPEGNRTQTEQQQPVVSQAEKHLDVSEEDSGSLRDTSLAGGVNSLDILDVVDKNERMNEVGHDKALDQGNQLLSFDKKFYQVKKKLFDYSEYPNISSKLFQGDQSRSVSTIDIVQNYLFIGNAGGVIRAFDLKTQKEMKSLKDEKELGSNNKVTSLNVSEDGGFLVSGYKGGQVALWDLVNYKLIKIVPGLHTTDVVNARVYHMDEAETLYCLTAEESGRVQHIKFIKKSFLGGYSVEPQLLFKQRLKYTTSIVLQKTNELYPSRFCEEASLVAFGAQNEVVVCQMRPKIKELYQQLKPPFCKEKSLPCIDWGYGLTPSHREKTVPLFAFAWDRLIQLFYINEATQTIELDGFYYSESEINALHFVGDSILFVLQNACEIKLLYTTKFYPGHFSFLLAMPAPNSSNPAQKINLELQGIRFQKVIDVTGHSELERGVDVIDLRPLQQQRHSEVNYTQRIKRYKNQLFFLGVKSLVRVKVFQWREYLDYLKYKENADMSTVLKSALDIYNGEYKGFAKVPDEKEVREGLLASFMKDLIKENVQQAIFKYSGVTTAKGGIGGADKVSSLQWDLIAIKSAIEFCLNINSAKLLFTEIYQVFAENGLETKFLANLEPFILAGAFKKPPATIPEPIIKKLVTYYEQRHEYKALEKVIMKVDVSDFVYLREELLVVCQVHCLIGALLHLMSSQKVNTDDQSVNYGGCKQILKTLLSLLQKSTSLDVDKDDIYMIFRVDSQKKYEIEKSRVYIGYKLLWMLRLFIEGKTFPSGSNLSIEKHRMHIYDISNLICTPECLTQLIQFDAEHLLCVLAKLYSSGQALKFLRTQKEWLSRNSVVGAGAKLELCPTPEKVINEDLLTLLKENPQHLLQFYNFILQVQAAQSEKDLPRLDLNDDLVSSAILAVIKCHQQIGVPVNEEQLIKAIQSKGIQGEQLERLARDRDVSQSSLGNLKIYLMETRGDYLNALKLVLQTPDLRPTLFAWIDRIFLKLSKENDETTSKVRESLEEHIKKSIQEILRVKVDQGVAMVDRWFDAAYQERLVTVELQGYREVQFGYVSNLLAQNEERVARCIDDSLLDSEKAPEAARYLKYLTTHVRGLCQFNPDAVPKYVAKSFYPVQDCLKVCQEEGNLQGVAVLLKRSGDHLRAIDCYLDLIRTRVDLLQLLKEVVAIQQAQQIPLALHQPLIALDFHSLDQEHQPQIYQFDELLLAALKISLEHGELVGEAAWLKILEFLDKYAFSVAGVINQALAPRKVDDPHKIERVRDFVGQRKTIVLKSLPESVSLQSLCAQLDLDFKEIETIYENKVHDYRENHKYLKLAKKIQHHELTNVQAKYLKLIKHGQPVEEYNACAKCGKEVFPLGGVGEQAVTPFLLFLCGHVYHQACIGGKDKEHDCPQCVREQIDLQSFQDPNSSKRGAKGGQMSRQAREDYEAQIQINKAKQLAQEFQESISAGGVAADAAAQSAAADSLFRRKLEVFDLTLQATGLSKTSFY